MTTNISKHFGAFFPAFWGQQLVFIFYILCTKNQNLVKPSFLVIMWLATLLRCLPSDHKVLNLIPSAIKI